MLIATGAAMVLLTIVWKPALLRFAWNASGSVVGSAERPTMMSGRASARRRSATRLHACLSLRARFRIEGAGGP
jgi:hypothetical protein